MLAWRAKVSYDKFTWKILKIVLEKDSNLTYRWGIVFKCTAKWICRYYFISKMTKIQTENAKILSVFPMIKNMTRFRFKLNPFSLVPFIESIIILRFQKTKWVRKNKLISNKNGCQCLGYLIGWNHTIHGLNLVVLHAISLMNYSTKVYLLWMALKVMTRGQGISLMLNWC